MRKVLFIFILISSSAYSEVLSLPDAIKIAIEKNFDILISDNTYLQNKISNSWGEVGLFPNVSTSLGTSFAPSINENLASATPKVENTSVSYNPSLQLNWQIFNGLKLRINKKKLELLEEKTNYDLKKTIASTINDVISKYYSAVAENNKVKLKQENLNFSKQKFLQAEQKYANGILNEFDFLQTKSILLNDSIQLIIQINNLTNSIRTLLEGISYPNIDEKIELSNDIDQNYSKYDFDSLKNLMFINNFELLSLKRVVERAELDIKLAKRNRLPTLGLNGFFNFSNSFGESSFELANSNGIGKQTINTGFKEQSKFTNYGVSFSLNFTIFNGFTIDRNIKRTILAHHISEIQYDKLSYSLSNQLIKSLNDYNQNLNLLELRKLERELNSLNLKIAEQKFNLGNLSIIDFRKIQVDLINSDTNYLDALVNTSKSKNNLLYLVGSIISDYSN